MLAYFVRHAESLSNLKQTDSLNAGLSDLGRRQADALANRLANAGLTAIYSSPYVRCIETAIPLAERLSLPIRIRPELCEFHHLPPGDVAPNELATIDEISRSHPLVSECPDVGDACDWAPTDEPFAALLERTRRFATFLKSHWMGHEAVVAFSHGSPIARIIDAWLTDATGPSFRFIIDNAAVSAVRFHAHVSSLVCLNEVSHMTGIAAPSAANYTDQRTIKAVPPGSYW